MLHSEAGWRVGEPSFVTERRRIINVKDGTLLHNLPQQITAYRPRFVKGDRGLYSRNTLRNRLTNMVMRHNYCK